MLIELGFTSYTKRASTFVSLVERKVFYTEGWAMLQKARAEQRPSKRRTRAAISRQIPGRTLLTAEMLPLKPGPYPTTGQLPILCRHTSGNLTRLTEMSIFTCAVSVHNNISSVAPTLVYEIKTVSIPNTVGG